MALTVGRRVYNMRLGIIPVAIAVGTLRAFFMQAARTAGSTWNLEE
jgi:hypothetical protein